MTYSKLTLYIVVAALAVAAFVQEAKAACSASNPFVQGFVCRITLFPVAVNPSRGVFGFIEVMIDDTQNATPGFTCSGSNVGSPIICSIGNSCPVGPFNYTQQQLSDIYENLYRAKVSNAVVTIETDPTCGFAMRIFF